jgi:hypothetical protein
LILCVDSPERIALASGPAQRRFFLLTNFRQLFYPYSNLPNRGIQAKLE